MVGKIGKKIKKYDHCDKFQGCAAVCRTLVVWPQSRNQLMLAIFRLGLRNVEFCHAARQ
jgi:hypothetical protein